MEAKSKKTKKNSLYLTIPPVGPISEYVFKLEILTMYYIQLEELAFFINIRFF